MSAVINQRCIHARPMPDRISEYLHQFRPKLNRCGRALWRTRGTHEGNDLSQSGYERPCLFPINSAQNWLSGSHLLSRQPRICAPESTAMSEPSMRPHVRNPLRVQRLHTGVDSAPCTSACTYFRSFALRGLSRISPNCLISRGLLSIIARSPAFGTPPAARARARSTEKNRSPDRMATGERWVRGRYGVRPAKLKSGEVKGGRRASTERRTQRSKTVNLLTSPLRGGEPTRRSSDEPDSGISEG